jgi:hypothetical protein
MIVLAIEKVDSGFPERLYRDPRSKSKVRRIVGKTLQELNPERSDLARRCFQSKSGHYFSKHDSGERLMIKILRLCCQVAGLEFGRDLRLRDLRLIDERGRPLMT